MRVIAGTRRGTQLCPIGKAVIRPTADRVREAVFNILGDRVENACVVDLFAGTGAFGIEALSRGARFVTFVESAAPSLRLIRKNLSRCRLTEQARILRWNIGRGLSCLKPLGATVNLVFIDPPYRQGHLLPALNHLDRSGCLTDGALIVMEHDRSDTVADESGRFTRTDHRRYGGTEVSFMNYSLA